MDYYKLLSYLEAEDREDKLRVATCSLFILEGEEEGTRRRGEEGQGRPFNSTVEEYGLFTGEGEDVVGTLP